MIEKKNGISAIDLFCGAGGLTHGLIRSGINVRLGIDNDPACEYPYSANNEATFLLKSIETITADLINRYLSEDNYSLLAGCAPCQTFSTYNPNASSSDTRWLLLKHFERLVLELEPDFVSMENVPGLIKHRVFNEFTASLRKKKYYVSYKIINTANLGIPQIRKRLILLASRFGDIAINENITSNSSYATVKEAIGSLSPITAGSRDSLDPLHVSAALSSTNILRIMSSKPGGTWNEWDEHLKVKCHKKQSGSTFGSVYGRMEWDKPSPTITTQFFGYGNGRFGHPQQHRALSIREGAILQSFPSDYRFIPPDSVPILRVLGRLIGNAVPPKLGEFIGGCLQEHVSMLK